MDIAILVYGRLDNFEKHYDTIIQSIGKDNNINFFLSTDNSPYILDFIELYKPISYNNDKIEFEHDLAKNISENRKSDTNFSNMTKHFVNKYRVLHLLNEHLIKENKSYDVVMSLRVDLDIRSKFDFSEIQENIIYIPEGYDYRGINDQIAYGKIEVMRKYNSLITNVFNIIDQTTDIVDPEILTLANINMNNLDIKRFYLDYSIEKELPNFNEIFGYGIYISEIHFMVIADFIHQGDLYFGYRGNKLFNPSKMFDNCIIYINLNFVHIFIEMMRNNKFKYILISGYSDYIVPYLRETEKFSPINTILNDQNLICWFGTNNISDHPKIKLIPTGISKTIPVVKYDQEQGDTMEWIYQMETHNAIKNFIRYRTEQMSIIERMRSKKISNKLIHISFSVSKTDTGFSSIRRYDNHRRYLDKYIREQTPFEHIQLSDWFNNISTIQEYKYSLCPHARCPDSYRIWESLIVGTVPIVFSSQIDELYQDLPILILDNFYQLNELYLEEQYDIIISRDDYKFEKLSIGYWEDIIRRTQNFSI